MMRRFLVLLVGLLIFATALPATDDGEGAGHEIPPIVPDGHGTVERSENPEYTFDAATAEPILTVDDNTSEDGSYLLSWNDIGGTVFVDGALPSQRGFSSAVMTGDSAFVFGGYDGTVVYKNEIVKYDSATHTASKMTETLPTRRYHTSAVWTGDVAYIFGGNDGTYLKDILRYDPDAHTVTKMTETLPSGRSGSCAVWTGDAAYIFGGYDGSCYKDIIRYDPASHAVTKMTETLPVGLSAMSAVWSGDCAYLFGGYDGTTRRKEIVRYDPAAHTVTSMTETLPTVRYGTSAVWTGNTAYIFGGYYNANIYLDDIVRYDPTNHSVQQAPESLPSARFGASAVWMDDCALLFGGQPYTSEILRYYPIRHYILEESRSEDFTNSTVIYQDCGLALQLSEKVNGIYYYRVKGIGGAWSNAIQVTVYRKVSIHLSSGWNLISIPSADKDYSVEEIFENLTGLLEIQTYDGETGSWLTYSSSSPSWVNSLTTISPKMGLWVKMDQANTLFVGRLPWNNQTEILLHEGWNLIGYPTARTNMTLSSVLSGIPWDICQRCDNTKPYNLMTVPGTFYLNPSEGYWIHVTEDSTLILAP